MLASPACSIRRRAAQPLRIYVRRGPRPKVVSQRQAIRGPWTADPQHCIRFWLVHSPDEVLDDPEGDSEDEDAGLAEVEPGVEGSSEGSSGALGQPSQPPKPPPGAGYFLPRFTHQLFPAGEIFGYRRLRIDIFFAAGSLRTLVRIRHRGILPSSVVPAELFGGSGPNRGAAGGLRFRWPSTPSPSLHSSFSPFEGGCEAVADGARKDLQPPKLCLVGEPRSARGSATGNSNRKRLAPVSEADSSDEQLHRQLGIRPPPPAGGWLPPPRLLNLAGGVSAAAAAPFLESHPTGGRSKRLRTAPLHLSKLAHQHHLSRTPSSSAPSSSSVSFATTASSSSSSSSAHTGGSGGAGAPPGAGGASLPSPRVRSLLRDSQLWYGRGFGSAGLRFGDSAAAASGSIGMEAAALVADDLTEESDLPLLDQAPCDVMGELASRLQPGFFTDPEAFRQQLRSEADWSPPGRLVHEYAAPGIPDAPVFQVYRASLRDAAVQDYHARMQFFLLFFIDASSYINAEDPNWEVLLLFRRSSPAAAASAHLSQPHPPGGAGRSRVVSAKGKAAGRAKTGFRYDFVGYMTLYRYFGGFSLRRRAEALAAAGDAQGRCWCLRISQVLILPPYQGAGHGKALMRFVYQEMLHAPGSAFLELNVEDPSPSFQFLRDMMDIWLCQQHRLFSEDCPVYAQVATAEEPEADGSSPGATETRLSRAELRLPPALRRLSPRYAARAGALLRISADQVFLCYLTLKLARLCGRCENLALAGWRREAFRELLRRHAVLLAVQFSDPALRQQELDGLFLKLLARCHRLAEKCGLYHAHGNPPVSCRCPP